MDKVGGNVTNTNQSLLAPHGVRIGHVIPGEALGTDIGAIRDYVIAAEALGYSHLIAYDHVLGAVHEGRDFPIAMPYDETTIFHEPMVLLGFLSAITSTLELATGVVVLPQRQTALVAKQATEVALLSGDRIRLGVGVGWNFVEYECLDQKFSNRGARIEEQITVLRELWANPVVDFAGQWHRIDRAGIQPRPAKMIPIWMGGFAHAAFERAARIADGFIASPFGPEGPNGDTHQKLRNLREMVDKAGREQSSFGIDLIIPFPVSPAELPAFVEQWSKAGITHMTLQALWGDPKTPADHIDLLHQYHAVLV
jgi:probable F420-dependent oxidoreductase